jgi:hypothetical protein
MIFGGDDRGPSAGTLNPYRLQAAVVLEAPSEQSALRLVGDGDFTAGVTTQFHKATTLADGVIDDNDYDELGDCHRRHRSGQYDGEKGSATLRGNALALELKGGNPLVVLAPKINASLDLDFRRSAAGDLVIDGEIAHDCMPAFELYIEGVAAYSWAPPAATLGSAVKILHCLRPPMSERGSLQCTENSQGRFTCRGQ